MSNSRKLVGYQTPSRWRGAASGSLLVLLISLLVPGFTLEESVASTYNKATSVEATKVSDVIVRVNWTAPAVEGGDPEVEEYKVEYRVQGATDWATTAARPALYTDFEIEAADNELNPTRILVSGLTPATTYEFRVKSIFDDAGESTSDTDTALTDDACTYEGARNEAGSSGNLFLGGKYIEVGISPVGSFGTSENKPSGGDHTWYGSEGSSKVGMSVDYDGFDCGVEDKRIDFFLPGSPEERWAAGFEDSSGTKRYIGVSELNDNLASGIVDTMATVESDTTITDLSSGSTLKASVETTLRESSGSEAVMRVEQVISFGASSQFFTNTVTVTNLSDDNWQEARFMRSFDPDNLSYVGGGTSTENRVVRSPANDGQDTALVQAQGSLSLFRNNSLATTFDTRAPILFYSSSTSARGSTWGFANSDVFNASAWDTPGTSTDSDTGMSITFRQANLNSGQSFSVVYVTSLDLRDFDDLEADIAAAQQEAEEAQSPLENQGSGGSSGGSRDDDESEAAMEPSVDANQPAAALPRPTPAPQTTGIPNIRRGPVLRGGLPPRNVSEPEVRVGGRTISVQTEVENPSRLSVRAGVLSLGVQVQQDEGTVTRAEDGTTEVSVRKGARTNLSGSGLRPDSTVQVFLPLEGSNAKELTRIPVGADGSFNGDAAFVTAPDEDPLPIGRQVLQLVSVDENGDEVVVDMTVNIAQPPPAPEFNRVDGVIPTQAPGTSIATNAGVPEEVRVSAVEDQKLAVVEGEGWSMAIGVLSEDGAVQSAEGGASITLVRDESAQVSGGGFMPGTRADVWLFSDPTLLGTVTIDDEGRFDGEVNIDGRVIAVGEHTLQLQGVGEDGYVRAANMGVTVGDSTVAAEETSTTSLALLWWVLGAAAVVAVATGVTIVRRRQLV